MRAAKSGVVETTAGVRIDRTMQQQQQQLHPSFAEQGRSQLYEQPQLMASGRYVTAPVTVPPAPPPPNYLKRPSEPTVAHSSEVAELKQQNEHLIMKNRQLLTEMERLEKVRLTKEEQSAKKVKALQSRIAELEEIIRERDLHPTSKFGANVVFRSELPGDEELPVIAWNDVDDTFDSDDQATYVPVNPKCAHKLRFGVRSPIPCALPSRPQHLPNESASIPRAPGRRGMVTSGGVPALPRTTGCCWGLPLRLLVR
jgi:type IV secretory pathway VirB10-like protein